MHLLLLGEFKCGIVCVMRMYLNGPYSFLYLTLTPKGKENDSYKTKEYKSFTEA